MDENKLLEFAYSLYTVNNMLTGKAYERAVRDHFLADTALNVSEVKKASDHESTQNAIDGRLQKFDKVLQSTDIN